VLCDDISLNRELIDTNVKEELSNYEIVEWKQISQSKLIEKELAHIIYTHNKVVNSGLPNYQGCTIPIYLPTIKRTCSIFDWMSKTVCLKWNQLFQVWQHEGDQTDLNI
jgi:hypothetical protein